MKKFALIPAFEPDERLVSLCHALKSKAYDVVVVDDGSDYGCPYAKIVHMR